VTLASAVFGVLSTNAAVAAIVGSGSAAKIYPTAVQEGKAAPYIVFWRTKNEDFRTLDGSLPTIEGMTLQFEIYGRTPAEVDSLCSAVEAALLPLKGDVTSPASGFIWEAVLHGTISDTYEAETGAYCADMTFDVMYRV
jgi:hypothetical protein